MVLPKAYLSALTLFIQEHTDPDTFHEMIACCCEAWNTKKRTSDATKLAKELIISILKKQATERFTLYHDKRNISLDQCIGDSRTPVSEWLLLDDWDEWT